MNPPEYTNDQQVERIWDKECVVQVMNRHTYCQYNGQRQLELDTLWVARPENRQTASLGYNNGYYTGMDEIVRHYVKEREELFFERLKPYCGADPGVALSPENLGLGAGEIQTATTPLVYLADDGQSARYLGYRLGYQATGKPDGSAEVYLDFGLIFCDLLKEDGQWKIWHLVLEHDHTVEAGRDYGKTPVRLPFGEDPLEREFGTPTIAQNVYQPFFGWEYMWQDMPRPYASYNDAESYGPKGCLGKPYYERERR